MKLGRSEVTTWLEIDLTAIKHNIREIKRHTRGLSLMPVVKANAYGHGMVEVARACEEMRVEYIGVVNVEEALELRRAGIKAPIFVLSYVGIFLPRRLLLEAIKKDIEFALFDVEMAHLLSTLGRQAKKTVKCHIKIDTGTTRVGIYPNEALKFAETVQKLPRVKIQGLFSHFAKAEETDRGPSVKQTSALKRVKQALEKSGKIPFVHIACSAALVSYVDSYFNLGRLGVSLYGLWPSLEVKSLFEKEISLKSALTWKSKVIQVKRVKKGTEIGYGGTYVAPRDMMIAVCAFGYADGFSRELSNKGLVLVKGKKAPVRGRVCMNLTMVDVTGIENVKSGSKITLIGRDGKNEITADDQAKLAKTINYEIVTRINWALPRFYKKK